jgi:two-component system, OmpR family, phosphate regulon sensor histidine kinase PhoR
MRNTERLIALVKDIQILSEVESGEGVLTLETVSVREIMETVMPLFEDASQKRNLSVTYVEDKPGLMLRADRYRVEQVPVNLIDNGLKYTDEGGVEIRVSSRGGKAVFAVSDSGRGIPVDLQERIFERFFVVDRSRSRKMGGTGLGLSISKHIVEAHGGTLSVSSTAGQGSIFLFTLPLAD